MTPHSSVDKDKDMYSSTQVTWRSWRSVNRLENGWGFPVGFSEKIHFYSSYSGT